MIDKPCWLSNRFLRGSNLVRATRLWFFQGLFSLWSRFMSSQVWPIEPGIQVWLKMPKTVCKNTTMEKIGLQKGTAPGKSFIQNSIPIGVSARKREKYLKSSAGKKWLLNYLKSNVNSSSLPDWRRSGGESRTGYKASRAISERLFCLSALRACSRKQENKKAMRHLRWSRGFG